MPDNNLYYKNLSSLKELFEALTNDFLTGNNHFSPEEFDIKNLNTIQRNIIAGLLKYHLWIYNYCPKKIKKRHSKSIHYRENYSAFIERKIAKKFATELSKQSHFVGFHDHLNNKSTIYINGEEKVWMKEDFVTVFEMQYDELGNPSHKKKEHIWDYGTNIEELREILTDSPLYKSFIENYIEISVIASYCDKSNSLINDSFKSMIKLEK